MRGFAAILALAVLAGVMLLLKLAPARAAAARGRIDTLTDRIEEWWLAPGSPPDQ